MRPELYQVNYSNPSFLIYYHYESHILSVRSSLFSSLKTKSDKIAAAAEKILEKKLNSKYEKDIPHLFEIFPWLLKDLTSLDYTKAHEISVNWLALYMYVSFLDDHLDRKTRIEPDEFIAASVLAQRGLISLFKIVDNTRYEELFRDSLICSAKYELMDIMEQAMIYNDIFKKSESASGKNAILLACAGAVAASTENDSDFIIELTRELLLSVQLLDDLTDIDEDVARGNITIPLNDVVSELDNSALNSSTIIGLMLKSKSLYYILERIESSLSNIITLIHTSTVNIHASNPAFVYFQNLLTNVSQLRVYIESIDDSFKNLSVVKQGRLIEKLESKLADIYCHT